MYSIIKSLSSNKKKKSNVIDVDYEEIDESS